MTALLVVWFSGCSTTPEAPTEPPPAPADPAAEQGKAGKQKRSRGKAKKPPAEVEKVEAQIFFLDQARFDRGEQPYLVAVQRQVGAKTPERNAVWTLFKGPTPEEEAAGLALVTSGAEGFTDLQIADGIATLKLRGGCDSSGSTLTIYDHLVATLTAFDSVDHVKLLDASGATQDPGGAGGSRPECLEP